MFLHKYLCHFLLELYSHLRSNNLAVGRLQLFYMEKVRLDLDFVKLEIQFRSKAETSIVGYLLSSSEL